MKISILRTVAAALLLALPCSAASAAVNIPIVNHSFEANNVNPGVNQVSGFVPGWVQSGTGGSGTWDISNGGDGFWTQLAPNGDQIAYLSSAPEAGSSPASLSQTLTATFQAGVTYNLAGFVGHPIGFGESQIGNTLYTVSLLAGNTTLVSSVPSTVTPSGVFSGFNLQYLFDASDAGLVGQLLTIVLSSNNAQTGFDNISLTATPEPATLVTWSVLGLAGFASVWYKRRNA